MEKKHISEVSPFNNSFKKDYINSPSEFCCGSHPHHPFSLSTLDCLPLLHFYPLETPEQELASSGGLIKHRCLGPASELLIGEVQNVAWETAFLTGSQVMLCCWSWQHSITVLCHSSLSLAPSLLDPYLLFFTIHLCSQISIVQ